MEDRPSLADISPKQKSVKRTAVAFNKQQAAIKKKVDEAVTKATEPLQNELLQSTIDLFTSQSEAVTDKMTGVYNRDFMETFGAKQVAEAVRYKEPISFLLWDIDSFKNINDVEGHPVGDEVIKEMFSIAKSVHQRESDVVGKIGGDEGLAVLTKTDAQNAVIFADLMRQRVHEALTQRFPEISARRDLTISVGVAEYSGNGNTSYQDLYKQADIALYNSKSDKDGNPLKNKVTLYQEGMTIPPKKG